MAVFTAVAKDDFIQWARSRYPNVIINNIVPISEGIENTNYLIQGSDADYVFTIFELWEKPAVEYYAALLQHLNNKNMPVPSPINVKVHEWQGKPCVLVPFIQGASIMQPQLSHCQLAGEILAKLHTTVADFTLQHENPRGYGWRRDSAQKILPAMASSQQELLQKALRVDTAFAQLPLPSSACHCDFFRNNVLWHDNVIVGIIDFYFGGQDRLIFDLAVCACDWCFNTEMQIFCDKKLQALLTSYNQHRRFCDLEKRYFADALCVAAMRFWISRWYDTIYPRQAETLSPHDPSYFELVLNDAIQRKDNIHQIVQAVA